MHILFVCSGNTCRSPMAEGYFRSLCEKSGLENMTCSSAGTFTSDGMPPSSSAIEVMKALGIDISSKRSIKLKAEDILGADMVIAMTAGHRSTIISMLPSALSKVRLLLDFADRKNGDVDDPFGGGVGVYGFCFEEMKDAIDNLFLDLKNKL